MFDCYDMTWWEFEGWLLDFENLVSDKVFQKMDYKLWKKLKWPRDNDTSVILLERKNGFEVEIGNHDEYFHFCYGDDSFGDFMKENYFDEKRGYYDDDLQYHPAYGYPLSTGHTAISDPTQYEKKGYKLDCDPDSLLCMASADYTTSTIKLNGDVVGIGTIAATHSEPTISLNIDGKVDKAEFESRIDELNDKLIGIIEKYNTIEKKEISNMKGFNFDFGPMNGNVVRMSIYGLAVKNKAGTWVSYDAKNEEIMDVDVFNFDGAKFIYKMPVAIKDVAIGDIIVHLSTPMFVIGKSEDGKAVYAVDPVAGERKEIMLTKSPFGFNFITKVVNFLGNAFTSADASNPFGNLGLMLMLSEDGNGVKDMLPLMLMANGGNIDMSNPLMLYALMGNDGKMGDMLPLMLMMNANQPQAHTCQCGQHNQ